MLPPLHINTQDVQPLRHLCIYIYIYFDIRLIERLIDKIQVPVIKHIRLL